MQAVPTSVYLHFPFCRQRCSYCDFNTYAGLDSLISDYTRSLCLEIQWVAQAADQVIPVHTLYLGGGTPSLLPVGELERVFQALQSAFHLLPGLEMTLEANPGTLDLPYLIDLRALGVNRLSLGVQSAQSAELRLLGRLHDFHDVIQSVAWARQAGFDNLNLDLIYGLPGQSLARWQNTLLQVLPLQPEHISLYSLTLEPGTPLARQVQQGQLPEPDPDLAADMYEWAADLLAQSGFFQYEISNWARDQRSTHHPGFPGETSTCQVLNSHLQNPAFACRHNLQYWRNLPYLGFGAGSHGFANHLRTANELSPAVYIQRLSQPGLPPNPRSPYPCSPATHTCQALDTAAEIADTMLMGLRLTREGISAATFYSRFGQSLEQVFSKPIQKLVDQGLLEWAGQADLHLRLTQRGRLLGNRVFQEFI